MGKFLRYIRSQALPLTLLVAGVALTACVVTALDRSAYETWKQSADHDTAQQSTTLLNRINESLTGLSSVAMLVDNGYLSSPASFYSAFDGLLGRAKSEFLSGKAVLNHTDGVWIASFSSTEPIAGLDFPDKGQSATALLSQTLTLARQSPNEWFMSAPYADKSGKRHVYVALAILNQPDTSIAAVLDLERFVESMLTTGKPGLDIQLLVE